MPSAVIYNGSHIWAQMVRTRRIRGLSELSFKDRWIVNEIPFSASGTTGLTTVAQEIIPAINEAALGGIPAPHASSHENGGADEIDLSGLSGTLADPQTAAVHASSHENGGADEIDVSGLSGTLADPQTAAVHALGSASHSASAITAVEALITTYSLLRYRGSVNTAAMLALGSPSSGDFVYNTDWRQPAWYNGNVWLCPQTVQRINRTGGTMFAGDVVTKDLANTSSVITTTTPADVDVEGVCVLGAANGQRVTIAKAGKWTLYTADAVNIGDWIETDTTAYQGRVALGGYGPGTFARADGAKAAGAGFVLCDIGLFQEIF